MRLLLFVLLLAPLPLAAEDYTSPEIASFAAGVMCAAHDIGSRAAPDTVAGETHIVEEAPPFVSDGRIVPAVIGVGFGVVSSVRGDVGLSNVRVFVTHPPMPGSGATEQSFTTSIGPSSDPGITFYQFDYDYELVTGEWTIEARFEDYVLYSSRFTIVPPEAIPELADACGFVDLLS